MLNKAVVLAGRHLGAVDFAASLIVRGAGALVAFAANVLIARILGPESFGNYVTLLSIGLVAGAISSLGVEPLILREVSASPRAHLGGTISLIAKWAATLTGIVSAVFVITVGVWMSSELGVPEHNFASKLAIATIIILSPWISICVGILKGLSEIAKSQAVRDLIKNGILLVGVGLLHILGSKNPSNVLFIQAIALVLSINIAIRWISRALSIAPIEMMRGFFSGRIEPEHLLSSKWMKPTLHFFSLAAAITVLGRLDVILVNALAGPIPAGLFGAAARIAQVITIPGLIWIAWLQPRLSSKFNRGDKAGLISVMRLGTIGAAGMTGVFVTAGFVFSPWIMKTLGDGYDGANMPFRIISLGYLIWGFAVPSYAALTMWGDESAASRIIWMQVVFTLLLSIPLISWLRAEGAAWAWTSGVVLASLLLIRKAKKTIAIVNRIGH